VPGVVDVGTVPRAVSGAGGRVLFVRRVSVVRRYVVRVRATHGVVTAVDSRSILLLPRMILFHRIISPCLFPIVQRKPPGNQRNMACLFPRHSAGMEKTMRFMFPPNSTDR